MMKTFILRNLKNTANVMPAIAFAVIILLFPLTAYANNAANPGQAPAYQFQTTFPANQWGQPTTSDVAAQHTQNIRRDRHSAALPPPHGTSTGFFSGEFATEQANPFAPRYNNNPNASHAVAIESPLFALLPGEAGVNVRPEGVQSGGFTVTHRPIAGAGIGAGAGAGAVAGTSQTPTQTGRITTVAPFQDGTIGRIIIPALNRHASVRPDVALSTLDNYVGHFPFSSQWDGNIALASHNRGQGSFFSGIWTLQHGDRIIYETTLGVRVYEVISIVQIRETDLSNLDHTHENMLTMVTCVYGQAGLRWSIRAKEIL